MITHLDSSIYNSSYPTEVLISKINEIIDEVNKFSVWTDVKGPKYSENPILGPGIRDHKLDLQGLKLDSIIGKTDTTEK